MYRVLSAEILRTKALAFVFDPVFLVHTALGTNILSSPGVPTFSRAYCSATLSFSDLCCLLAPLPNHWWDICWSLPVLTLSLVNKSTMRHGINRVTGSKFYLLGKTKTPNSSDTCRPNSYLSLAHLYRWLGASFLSPGQNKSPATLPPLDLTSLSNPKLRVRMTLITFLSSVGVVVSYRNSIHTIQILLIWELLENGGKTVK